MRQQLAAAKELRNRWKDADEAAAVAAENNAEELLLSPQPLSGYEIEQMLGTIFAAFDEALGVAEREVREKSKGKGGAVGGTGAGDTGAGDTGAAGASATSAGSVAAGAGGESNNSRRYSYGPEAMDIDGEEVPWEAVQNVMDWEMVL